MATTEFSSARKFSESSLDKFTTQFLQETDPQLALSPKTYETSTQTDNCENLNELLNIGDNTTASSFGEDHEKPTTSSQPRPSFSNNTLSVDSNETAVITFNKDINTSDSVCTDLPVILEPSSEFQIKDQVETPSGLLEYHLQVMYCSGVSSYRREEYKPIPRKLQIFQRALFWVFCVFSCIYFLCQAKNETVRFAALKDLKYCVQFGYAMVQLIERGFFIYLIAFLPAKISTMLSNVRNVFQYQNSALNNRFHKRVRVLVICSFVLTCVSAFFGYIWLSDFDMEELIQARTLRMSVTLFVWNTNKTIYEDQMDELIDEYFGDRIETSHVLMGLSEGSLYFCATHQGDMIRNFLLVSATVLWISWRYFENRVEPLIQSHPNNAADAEVEACLKHYKALRMATAAINGSLKPVFNSHMLQNLFLFGYAIKATMMFYTALRSYWTNGNVSTWLRLMTSYKGPVDVEAILGMTVQAALDDIRDNPIGFGLDYFLINENFLMGFFAIVASIISMLMELENKPAC